MGEYFPGAIELGGNIPAEMLDQLAEVISEQGCYLDDGSEAELTPAEALQLLHKADKEKTVLKLADYQASWGEFDDLEAFCNEHGIDYDRTSDAHYEYNGEMICSRGTNDRIWFLADQEGQPAIHLTDIQAVLDDKISDIAKLDKITKLVDPVPDLTPINIVVPGAA